MPDHSSLSKIRSRYEGEGLYLDATRVDANASIHHLRTRLSVIATKEHVTQVFAENPDQEAAQADETPPVAQSEGKFRRR